MPARSAPTEPRRAPDTTFWPDQVLKDSVAALGVLVVVLGLTVYYHGAELTAPADPANPYNAARPEWYFLFLFQFLKWFPGELEVWGAFIIPGAITGVLFLMPWIGKSRAGHQFNVGLMVVLLGGIALLTGQALRDDYMAKWTPQTEENEQQWVASFEFLEAKASAAHEAERAIELSSSPDKIPPTGALAMIYADPYLQGPRLFEQYCAGCHSYVDRSRPEGTGNIVRGHPSAPNLFGVGSRAWIEGLLDPEKVSSADYFGYHGSPFVGDGDYTEMVDFVHEAFEGADEEQREIVKSAFKKIAAALSAEAFLPQQVEMDQQDEAMIAEGRALIEGGLADVLESGMSCTDCHSFGDQQDIGSPVLDGYMSKEWLEDFIRNPADERFYGELNDRMPQFAPHIDPQFNELDDESLELIVDWLRGDWYRPTEEPTAE